jgi:iron complex outermembrane receptor protein
VLGQPTQRDRLSYSAFVNGEFKLFPDRWPDRLTLDAGARYDGYDQFDDAFNPRAALIYQPWKGSTFKAVYGTAFRTPNFYELFDPRHQDIRPEEVATYELICEQGIGRNFRASASGFYNRIDDVIAFDFQPAGMRGRIGYTFQDTENLETHLRPIDSPQHLVKANLSVPFWGERIIAGAEAQYTSQRTSVAPGPDGTLVPGGDAEASVLVNVTLLARKLPVKGLEISASVYNLFDERYADPATPFHLQDLIPQPGRTFRVKATYRF